MSDFKEFQGKNLDEAISEACRYFNVEREKLEINIMNDAKSGIFGLVGAKKAAIQARRALSVDESLKLEKETEKAKKAQPKKADKETDDTCAVEQTQKKQPEKPKPKKSSKPLAKQHAETKNLSEAAEPDTPAASATAASDVPFETGSSATEAVPPQKREPRKPVRATRNTAGAAKAPAAKGENDADGDEVEEETVRRVPFLDLESMDKARVDEVVLQVMHKLVDAIVDEATYEVLLEDSRIRVTIDCGESTGILVGREGTTLAALQYLGSRLIARDLGGPVRLQIDVGNYRERQDERLKELALFLGEKAKKTRRSQSTKPLSAYQRRIIHLALEEDEELQTHSKGEGGHRRVIIQLRRQNGGGRRRPGRDAARTEPLENDSPAPGNEQTDSAREPDSQLDFNLGL